MKDSLFNELRSILAQANGGAIPLDEITMDTRLIEDLGMDSISIIDFITCLEERYKFTFEDEFLLLENLNSFSSIYDFVKKSSPRF